jgi:hypothetical protein
MASLNEESLVQATTADYLEEPLGDQSVCTTAQFRLNRES